MRVPPNRRASRAPRPRSREPRVSRRFSSAPPVSSCAHPSRAMPRRRSAPDSAHRVRPRRSSRWSRTPRRSRTGTGPKMTPRKPASALAERWTMIDGVDVFYRESANPPDARVMTHLHGFGLSGRYLLPTAELLADEFHTYVPDLPGFGRSGKKGAALDIPDLAHARAAVPRRSGRGEDEHRGQLDGLPGDRRARAPLSRARRPGDPGLAGGRHPQSAPAPCDGPAREGRRPRAAAR